jgi:hypothetical protein
MKMKDRFRIVLPPRRRVWRAFAISMHLHENPCIKRAGVAGLRACVLKFRSWIVLCFEVNDFAAANLPIISALMATVNV